LAPRGVRADSDEAFGASNDDVLVEEAVRTTRLGFAKSDLSGDGARTSGRADQGAPTVPGRAPSMPPVEARAPGPAPAQPPTTTPAPPLPGAPPLHTGKSNFPARAGFWGRRDDNGELVPLTDPGFLVRSWHRRAQLVRVVRGLIIVIGSAALGFAAVYLVMELRQRQAPAPPSVTTPVPPPAPRAAPAPAAVAPAPARVVGPARSRPRGRPVQPTAHDGK
jgi:hypothetical protein